MTAVYVVTSLGPGPTRPGEVLVPCPVRPGAPYPFHDESRSYPA